jgi:DNA-binding CsgD family transcriptional regulator
MAALIRPELEPYAGTGITVGGGVAFFGAADRYLGMLAGTVGDWDGACRSFDAALELNRRMGARTWLAHTTYEYGRMLTSRGRSEDAAEVDSLLSEATTLAEQIGMRALLARIRALQSPAPAGSGLPDDLSPREADILRLVARGLSNRQIGEQLVISEHTAANHVRSILRKTSSANRTEAAGYAHRHGLAGASGRE